VGAVGGGGVGGGEGGWGGMGSEWGVRSGGVWRLDVLKWEKINAIVAKVNSKRFPQLGDDSLNPHRKEEGKGGV